MNRSLGVAFLKSALARPRQRFAYDESADIIGMAIASGPARNTEAQAVLNLASGELDEIGTSSFSGRM